MHQSRLLAAAAVIALAGSNVKADDSAEVKRLQEQLNAATKEIQKLSEKFKDLTAQKDNLEASLTANNKKLREDNERMRLKLKAAGGVIRILDLVKANAKLFGDYQETTQCECTLAIKEINGNKFKGCFSVILYRSGATTVTSDVEGSTFGDDKFSFQSVNSKDRFTVTGTLKCESIEIEYSDSSGTKGKGALKLAR